jgi:hypothetical protein
VCVETVADFIFPVACSQYFIVVKASSSVVLSVTFSLVATTKARNAR